MWAMRWMMPLLRGRRNPRILGEAADLHVPRLLGKTETKIRDKPSRGKDGAVERTCRRVPAQAGSVRGYLWQRTFGYGPLDKTGDEMILKKNDVGLFVTTMWTKPLKQCDD